MKVFSQHNAISVIVRIGLVLFLVACDSSLKDSSPVQNNEATNQQALLAELDDMQLKWREQGVEEYEFELQRECLDCPDVAQASVTVTGRSHEDPYAAQITPNQTNNINNYFADLRQAILADQVKSINYNTQYGYPQQVNLVSPDNSLATSLYIRDFRVTQQNPVTSVSLQGKLNKVANSGIPLPADYYLLTNNGYFRLQIPYSLNQIVSAIASGADVNVTGNWIRGNYYGQLQLLVTSIQQAPLYGNRISVEGTLSWTPGSGNFLLFDGYSTYTLNVPIHLQSLATDYALARQKVQITGIAQNYYYGTMLVAENIALAQQTLEQFSGTLTGWGNPCVGCPVSYQLQQDNGAILQLSLNYALQAQASALMNQRVRITGFRVYQGGGAQTVIDVRQIMQYPNLVTEVNLVGAIVNVLPVNYIDNAQRYVLQINNGSSVVISLAPSLQTGLPLSVGMRLYVVGSWAINPYTGQTELRLNRAPQILDNPGQYIRYEGTVIALDCNKATYNTYYYVSDSGQALRLRVDNALNTIVVPQARYAVSGMVQGNEFVATRVEPIASVAVMPPPISGTITAIDSVDPLACTQVYRYRLLSDNGLQQTMRVSSAMGNNVIQSLIPGKRVVITRYHLSTSNTVIDVLDFDQSANGQLTQLEGAIVALDCIQGLYNSYYFASISGETYTLEIRNLQQIPNFALNIGVSVVVDGVLNNNIIDASRIELHPIRTLLPPFARGTLISTGPIKTLGCGSQLYSFNFQNENGLNQIVYITPQLYFANMTLFNIGSRVEFNLPSVLGTNDPVLYPVSVRLFN